MRGRYSTVREKINEYKRKWRLSKKKEIKCVACDNRFVEYKNKKYCNSKCRPNYHKFKNYKVCEQCSERYQPSGNAQIKCTRCKRGLNFKKKLIIKL